jgi:hypothetical protein
METSDVGENRASILGRNALRLRCDPSHRSRQEGSVANTSLSAMPRLARAQNGGDVSFRGIGQPVARHGSRRRLRREGVKRLVKFGVIEFGKLTTREGVQASLGLHAQKIELQLLRSQPRLKAAHGVAHRFAGVLILARAHDLFDEGVLFGR